METGFEPPLPPLELLLPLDQSDPLPLVQDEALLEPLAQSSVATGDHEEAPLELPLDQSEPPLEPPDGLDGGLGAVFCTGLGVCFDLGLGAGGLGLLPPLLELLLPPPDDQLEEEPLDQSVVPLPPVDQLLEVDASS